MDGVRNARSDENVGASNSATANNGPSEGTARSELASVTNHLARPVCPTQSPSGMATTAAITTASRLYQRCCTIRAPRPESPDHVCAEVSHSRMLGITAGLLTRAATA